MLRFRIDVFLRELRCSFLEILTTRWPCYKNERQVAIDWYENRAENFFPNEMDGRSVLILYLVRFAAEDILFTGRFRMFERFTKQIDAAVIRWKNLSLVIRQKYFVRIDVFLRELRCSFLEILTTRWPCYKNERQVAIDWYENRVENFFPNEMDGRSVLILYLVRFAAEDILFIGRFRIRWKNLSLVIRQKCFVLTDE